MTVAGHTVPPQSRQWDNDFFAQCPNILKKDAADFISRCDSFPSDETSPVVFIAYSGDENARKNAAVAAGMSLLMCRKKMHIATSFGVHAGIVDPKGPRLPDVFGLTWILGGAVTTTQVPHFVAPHIEARIYSPGDRSTVVALNERLLRASPEFQSMLECGLAEWHYWSAITP